MGVWGGKRRPHTAARKIASRAACVGRQTARDPGFSDQLQLWGLAQVAWTDACCLARSSEPPDQSNCLCFLPKWTSRPPDPAFSWIPGPKKLDIQQKFPVGVKSVDVRAAEEGRTEERCGGRVERSGAGSYFYDTLGVHAYLSIARRMDC